MDSALRRHRHGEVPTSASRRTLPGRVSEMGEGAGTDCSGVTRAAVLHVKAPGCWHHVGRSGSAHCRSPWRDRRIHERGLGK
jgi:hypothetical protein